MIKSIMGSAPVPVVKAVAKGRLPLRIDSGKFAEVLKSIAKFGG